MIEQQKRTWVWIMKPQKYEIACDICGGSNIEWSEFEHMIWCYECQKDTPGNGGIFDGPIPLGACALLGLSFDRVDLQTGKRLYLHATRGEITWDETPANNGMNPIAGASLNEDGQ